MERLQILMKTLHLFAITNIILGKTEEAQKLLERLTALPLSFYPHLESHLQQNRSNFLTFYLLACIQCLHGNTEAALQSTNQCLEVNSSFMPSKYLQGTLLKLKKEFSLAVECFRECSQLQSYRSSDSMNMIGCIQVDAVRK